MIGSVVISKAGRDKGKPQVVVAAEETCVFVCDGKEHPLNRPKRKSLKHISFTSHTLRENQLETNKRLRRALFELDGAGIEEEN